MKWYDLAKTLMKSQGINQEQLAEHLGITKGAVSHWLNGRREPSLGEIAKIFQYLGKQNFFVGAGGLITVDPDAENPTSCSTCTKYPVISHSMARMWDTKNELPHLQEIDLWLESDTHIHGNAFWLVVEGDSMTSPVGLSIAEGAFVLVDTGRIPVSGSLVVAKLSDADEVTFKKLIIDGGMKYLKGLNPQWPLLPLSRNSQIIGVAVETKMRLV